MQLTIKLQPGLDEVLEKPLKLCGSIIGHISEYNKDTGQATIKIKDASVDIMEEYIEKQTNEQIFVSSRSNDDFSEED